MKINIGTNKKNFIGVEIDKPFEEITCSDVLQAIPEKYRQDSSLMILGWGETPKEKEEDSTILQHSKDESMKELTIYKFQLEQIIEALRLTSLLNNCQRKTSCYDRQVVRAMLYAKNVMEGKKEKEIPII